ncbi:GSCOCG00007543001-RA-CDS [Cotesia congregata]|uniref:Syntaxin-18 n=1 Tax=Cotesia congregata TaxID=51543 RepID=A0A8J2MXD7_COTCN|nr:GSCOCG00007543001-RA-CDS [Cotesia congregata]CAG5101611.1 Similar to Stx18: Syntaxin-18 (Mus musculus) [Cotesia congregata]
MDVSTLFRASVKSVSIRQKALDDDKSKLFPRKLRHESNFYKKSLAVTTQITRLKEFLLENRSAYLNFSGHLISQPRMSDAERDKIDNGAQEIISKCSQLIKELKREAADTDVSQQHHEHQEIMLFLIDEYLKNVCKIYSEQKAIRVKKILELKNLSKLELNIKSIEENSYKPPLNSVEEKKNSSTSSSPLKVQEMNGDVNSLAYEEQLSTEDVQMFEAENEQLYNELNTITEEVKQIESKVVHIAELQEVFTEKVLAQDHDLEKLVTTVVGSTENVKEANEQIRQAIQRNAGLRVWLLFFLLVMSFSLLFLDWYNP